MEAEVKNIKQYEQALRDIQNLLCVCSHVAKCDILNCPHRRLHAPFACPIMGAHPSGMCVINPRDKLTCVLLDMQVVVYAEQGF